MRFGAAFDQVLLLQPDVFRRVVVSEVGEVDEHFTHGQGIGIILKAEFGQSFEELVGEKGDVFEPERRNARSHLVQRHQRLLRSRPVTKFLEQECEHRLQDGQERRIVLTRDGERANLRIFYTLDRRRSLVQGSKKLALFVAKQKTHSAIR